MIRWPHQRHAVAETLGAFARGVRRVCVTVPTGGGKTLIAADVIRDFRLRGLPSLLYTNRRLLLEQTSEKFADAELEPALRAAGWGRDDDALLQVAMIQTDLSRVCRRGTDTLWPASLVVVDECHLFGGGKSQEVLDAYAEAGAFVLGLTATPVGLGGRYDLLVQAGTNSELRACGALVPAEHYAPDEPDLRHVGKVPYGEDIPYEKNKALVMVEGVFGRVIDNWRRLNPGQRPTILFAPGVPESLWFAQKFQEAGVPAAHIDGDCVWDRGKFYDSDRAARQGVLDASRTGEIRVLCNRFVLREGIDAPWVICGIFATVFGSLQSYLQSGGRLLRTCAGKDRAIVQDHGGNWHRHGSLNADRTWTLRDTPASVAGLRREDLRRDPGKEPRRCPKCSRVNPGRVCWGCGYEARPREKVRCVVQSDGRLRPVCGDVFPPLRSRREPDTAVKWRSVFHRMRNAGDKTLNQAIGYFEHLYGYRPPADFPNMPKDPYDLYQLIGDIPPERLHR